MPRQAGPGQPTGSARTALLAVLCALAVLAAALRAPGLSFALPYAYASVDETIVTDHARALASGDLDPHYFFYPTFGTYQVGALFEGYARLAALRTDQATTAIRDRYYTDPTTHFRIARGHGVLMGVLAVLVTALLGAELVRAMPKLPGGAPVLAAWFAGLALATNLLHCHLSRFVQLDVPLAGWTALALLACLRHLRTGSLASLLVACGAAGLGGSTKYYGALLSLSIAAVVALRAVHAEGAGFAFARAARRLVLAGLATVAAFLAGSPYVLLDLPKFREDFSELLRHNQDLGHFGQEIAQNGFRVYGEWLWHPWGGAVLCVGAGLGVLALPGHRPGQRALVPLLAFPLAFYGVIGGMVAQFPGYLCAPMPALAALAGVAAAAVLGRLPSPRTRTIAAVLLSLVFVPDALRAFDDAELFTRPDTRVLLRDHAVEHLEDGAVIAVDTWPLLPLSRSCLESMQRRIDAEREGSFLPLGTERSLGPLTPEHVAALLAEARRASETPGPRFDVAQVPPPFMDPDRLVDMRSAGVRYVLCTESRYQPILEGAARSDPDYLARRPAHARRVAYYERLLRGDLEIARFPSTPGERTQGPTLVLCDLSRLPPQPPLGPDDR